MTEPVACRAVLEAKWHEQEKAQKRQDFGRRGPFLWAMAV